MSNFEPLMCFARKPTQTPDEVFDMLQERMIAMLGYAYAEKGLSPINWNPESSVTYQEMDALSDWHHTSMVMCAKDFDRLGEKVGLSMADVLGVPQVDSSVKKAIESHFDMSSFFDGLDPVATCVTISALDAFDEMAEHRKAMSETQAFSV